MGQRPSPAVRSGPGHRAPAASASYCRAVIRHRPWPPTRLASVPRSALRRSRALGADGFRRSDAAARSTPDHVQHAAGIKPQLGGHMPARASIQVRTADAPRPETRQKLVRHRSGGTDEEVACLWTSPQAPFRRRGARSRRSKGRSCDLRGLRYARLGERDRREHPSRGARGQRGGSGRGCGLRCRRNGPPGLRGSRSLLNLAERVLGDVIGAAHMGHHRPAAPRTRP